MSIVEEVEPWRERLLLQALGDEVRIILTETFRGGLTMPVLALDDATTRFAAWVPATRTLTVSRAFLRQASWVAVREVLRHECAHQYVSEVLGVGDETAHGETFRKVCAERGIDAAAAGVIDGVLVSGVAGAVVDDEVERVLRRVEKLLALAQSDNPNEAEAAADAARRLMLEHNLAARGRPRRYVVRTLGAPVTRMHAHEKLLGALLSNHYFVEVLIVRAWCHEAARIGTILEVSGTPENVEMATWVHAFLHGAAERCWRDEQGRRGLAGRERLPFFAGFMTGVHDKLAREKQAQEQRGLVWMGDADLERFHRLRHPHVRGGRITGTASDGHSAGRQAGQDVVIARPVEAAPEQRGRLLTGR